MDKDLLEAAFVATELERKAEERRRYCREKMRQLRKRRKEKAVGCPDSGALERLTWAIEEMVRRQKEEGL